MVCGSDRVQERIRKYFIPAAEDELRFGEAVAWGDKPNSPAAKTPEFQLLDKIVRQGHMKGGANVFHVQGFYVVTPSGRLLASVNTVGAPEELVNVLDDGLAKWKLTPRASRLLPEPPDPKLAVIGGANKDLYPEDGLVLRAVTRSLPDPRLSPQQGTSHPKFYRLDHAWFRKDEAREFLPEKVAAGAKHELPRHLVERLALYHLGTNVDGINGIRKDSLREARLSVEVVAVRDGAAELRLEGATRMHGPSWTAPKENVGYRCKLLGRAAYDLKAERFTAFELVAVGTRTFGAKEIPIGAPNPLPVGVVFRLAENRQPADREPPRFIKEYGW